MIDYWEENWFPILTDGSDHYCNEIQENKYIPKCNWYTAYTTKTCIKWWELQIKSKDPGNQRSGMFVPPMKAPIMAMTSWNQESLCILDTQVYWPFSYHQYDVFEWIRMSSSNFNVSQSYTSHTDQERSEETEKWFFFLIVIYVIEVWKLLIMTVDNHSTLNVGW